MSRFSSEWLRDREAREHAKANPEKPSGEGCDRESQLHAYIIDDCKRLQWIALHGSMTHRTFRTPGEPDFIILRGLGRTMLVECKTLTGKLTKEQSEFRAWAEKLEHTVHVVRSVEDWERLK